MSLAPRSLGEHVALAQTILEAAGLGSVEARRDASLLARAALGWDAARWLAHHSDPAPAGFGEMFDRSITRRALREPIAYIVGEREFYGRVFSVSPAVLIPRPETELLVEESLWAARSDGDRGITLVDVGTGSGCVAVTLAIELPRAAVIATDVSADALHVARGNAERYHVADRIRFVHAPFLPASADPIDLVVSNPPYVPDRDTSSLMPEVARHEPALALFGGPDGLDVIRELLPAAAAQLRTGGHLVMEIGDGQSDEVQILAKSAGLGVLRISTDLQNIPRVLVAHR